MNDNDKYKSLDSEFLWNMDVEVSVGKKFIILKIRRTIEKGDIFIEEIFLKNFVFLVRLF